MTLNATWELELGVSFVINGKKEVIFGTLTALVADNLSSHQVGGFKTGFSKGFRKCKSCLAVDEDIQTKFSDCDHVPRTKEQHDLTCASMCVPELTEHFSKLYGLNHNSVLNTLKYFHVINGLPPDIMHDMQEGIIPLIICLVLLVFSTKKIAVFCSAIWRVLDVLNLADLSTYWFPRESLYSCVKC